MSSSVHRLTCSFCRFASSFSRCSGGSLRRRSCRAAGAQQRPSGARCRVQAGLTGYPRHGYVGCCRCSASGWLCAAAALRRQAHAHAHAHAVPAPPAAWPCAAPPPACASRPAATRRRGKQAWKHMLQACGNTGSESVVHASWSSCDRAAPSSHHRPPQQRKLACLLAGASSRLALGTRIRGPLLLLCALRSKGVDSRGAMSLLHNSAQRSAGCCGSGQHDAWRVQRRT